MGNLEVWAIALVPIALSAGSALIFWMGQMSRALRDHDESISDINKKLEVLEERMVSQ